MMRKSFQLSALFKVSLFTFLIMIASYLVTKLRSDPPMSPTNALCLAKNSNTPFIRRTLCPKAQTKSYKIKGKHYQPQKHIEYKVTGIASYYGIRDKFHGKKTAIGEVFNAHGLTAAHKTLPLPCYVKVTNLANNKSLILKVNDRGPFFQDRIIDVSEKAAKLLGFYAGGTTKVQVETLPEESIELQNNGTEIEPTQAQLIQTS